MSRSRGHENRKQTLPDKSLIVATENDVLFRPLEDGGDWFLKYRSLKLQDYRRQLLVQEIVEMESEEDVKFLRSLEPTEWKDQDHYAVLGLQHLRIRATEADIRKNYRARCLRHHPDKRMGAGETVNFESDYFACIIKAFEVLTTKRQSYDSIDPKFDNYIPVKTLQTNEDFFTVYGRWFELNSRWSNKTPVPLLGNMETSREKVEEFYNFWYTFDSWREYSYLDEEEKEKGTDREERRYIDKQNKAARAKLKKEEMGRIRSVVDAAYELDPRIKFFKEEEQRIKQEKKLEKRRALMEKQLAEEMRKKHAEEIAKQERELLEAKARERELNAKREKEAAKKALKKERKTFRTLCQKHNYFCQDEETKVKHMECIETLCETLTTAELADFNSQLAAMNYEEATELFYNKNAKLNARIEAEKAETTVLAQLKPGNENSVRSAMEEWNPEELNVLIKAVNVFPAGTVQRWDVVANFLHQHYPSRRKRTAKEVLAKAKNLKDSDFSRNSLKEMANKGAYTSFEKHIKTQAIYSEETTRESPIKENTEGSVAEGRPWTMEEQKLLEQALKTFPSSVPDRWDRISDCIPGRNKMECVLRFKELAALVKAKKLAQNAAPS